MVRLCYNRLVNAEAGDISNLPVNESVIPNQRRNWTGFQIFVVYFFIAWRALAKTTRDTIMQQVTERFAQVASDDDIEIDRNSNNIKNFNFHRYNGQNELLSINLKGHHTQSQRKSNGF